MTGRQAHERARASHDVKLTEAEGFAAIALIAVKADGVIVPEEAAGLATTLARMRMYREWTQARVIATLNKLTELLKKEGLEVTLRAAAATLRPEFRETAYAVAANLVMADHVVNDLEEEALSRIQHHLGLDNETARPLFHAMMIKNRG